MKQFLFLFIFFNYSITAQNNICIEDICIDSLVSNVEYSKKYLLKVEDKFTLIDSLLLYEGNLEKNPTWCNDFAPVRAEIRASKYPELLSISNQAVSLFLDEAIIRNNLFFNDSTTYLLYRNKDKSKNYGSLPGYKLKTLYSLGEILYFIDCVPYYKILNSKDFKKLFKIYKKWLKKVKAFKVPFEEIPQKYKDPLSGTNYAWTIEDFKRRDKEKRKNAPRR